MHRPRAVSTQPQSSAHDVSLALSLFSLFALSLLSLRPSRTPQLSFTLTAPCFGGGWVSCFFTCVCWEGGGEGGGGGFALLNCGSLAGLWSQRIRIHMAIRRRRTSTPAGNRYLPLAVALDVGGGGGEEHTTHSVPARRDPCRGLWEVWVAYSCVTKWRGKNVFSPFSNCASGRH